MKWIPKFRFRLRTMLILITLICVALTPVGMRINQGYQQQQAVAWVLENGGSVTYQYEHAEYQVDPQNQSISIIETDPSTPKWLRDIFGHNFFETVIAVDLTKGEYGAFLDFPIIFLTNKGNEDFLLTKNLYPTIQTDNDASRLTNINKLAQFKSLERVNLSGTLVTDLSPLTNHQNLRVLYLGNTPIRNLAPLAQLDQIETLHLFNCPISDISFLSNFKELKSLNLSGTQVADLTPLSNIKTLQVIDLSGSKVTDLSAIMGNNHLKQLYLTNTKVSKQDLLGIQAKTGCCLDVP
ncbi:MAG: hypothetical protein COA78_15165 [Blastopirellula sp.]|nr:MAG: hypothetical protein COA78_15165 [Blastopirellula sp.]